MRCKLCDKPTGKLFGMYHESCKLKLKSEISDMDSVLNEFENDIYTWEFARRKLIEITASGYINRFYTNNIIQKSDIDTHDSVIYSYHSTEVLEEKNRCQMKCSGNSYARYPHWKPITYKISNSATIVLTDYSLYILDSYVLRFPYSKIVNIGTETLFGKTAFFFDVKTSSPHRHRYTVYVHDKKDSQTVTQHLYKISKLMTGIGCKK